MSRRKQASDVVEINVWPSSLPEDVGSISPPAGELSVDIDDLGWRYLTDAVEQEPAVTPLPFGEEYDDFEVDLRAVEGLLRSFALQPSGARRRSGVRAVPPGLRQSAARAPASLPDDPSDHGGATDELDLTDEAVHEASLLDCEGEEAGEVRSPWLRTDDTGSHAKPRGGHARGNVRPLPTRR